MSYSIDPQRLEILILARLAGSKAKNGVKLKDLYSSLETYTQGVATPAELRELVGAAIERLTASGELERKPLALSEAGKTRLRDLFGPRIELSWKAITRTHLPVKALAMDAPDDKVRARLKDREGLWACLLKRELDIPGSETPTLTQAIDTLVWRHLGVDSSKTLTLSDIREYVLAKHLGIEPKLAGDKSYKRAQRLMTAKLTGTAQVELNPLLRKLIGDWLRKGSEGGAKAASAAGQADAAAEESRGEPADDLAVFAERVNTAAGEVEEGRFGDRKVFISALWRHLYPEPASMTLAAFKERLILANRRGLVRLHRADVVELMRPEDVRESEIQYLNATLHFVEIPTRRQP